MSQHLTLNLGWSFRRIGDAGLEIPWAEVDLPHSPFVSDLDGRNHWFGECEYRHPLEVPVLEAGGSVALYVGAAMQTARVFIDQVEIARHEGGYLPFEVDLTKTLAGRQTAELLLRLDNRANPDIPPGKPYEDLDFCWYGGLYRSVELRVRPALHLTDAIAAGVKAGGGLFLRTLSATESTARVRVEAHLCNGGGAPRECRVHVEFLFAGTFVSHATSEPATIRPGYPQQIGLEVNVDRPRLWSPGAPHLYEVIVTILAPDGQIIDARTERFGLRRLAFSRSGGFTLNGRRLRLRGTNRHQEMPAVGYAVPRAAQYRDALRIKEAGFDYVRLSHYPQSPDFLDACDELGLLVMNCIPGWQFLGGEQFARACVKNARELIRRDRNHASVVLWELSLNETPMDDAFMARMHAAGHEEYPGDQMFTCGWMDAFDVFIHSRQHGKIHSWSNGDKALVIAEYGDWEYYAANAGFEQKTGAGIFDRASNSRQFRGDGERALRQQVSNHQAALNDTLASPAVLDGQWAVFDYARGYDAERAAVGVMDIFRLPKFSYYFYRSQRNPADLIAGHRAGYNLFIASHWTAASSLSVAVFSNCDEVELRLNGDPIARQPRSSKISTQHLPYPPYLFSLPKFVPGALEAVGYVDGMPCARHRVSTPTAAVSLELSVDDLGIFPAENEPDVLVAHARLLDAQGTLCIAERPTVSFLVTGASLPDPSPVKAEAGIGSIVLRLPPQSSGFTLKATCAGNTALLPATVAWERKGVKLISGATSAEIPHVAVP